MHVRTIIFVAGVAAGIVAGLSSLLASELAVAALILCGLQGVIYIVMRKRETKGLALSLFTSIFCFAFFTGVVRTQLIEEKVPYVCNGACSFEGAIVSSPESKEAYQTYIVQPDGKEQNAYNVQVRTSLYPKYEIGERLWLNGKVRVPDTMFPHAGEKAFDYASYLHTKNVGSEMLFPKIETLGTGEKTAAVILGRWRGHFVEKINSYVSSPANMLAAGMLFGNSSMSQSLSDSFRTAGLSHIIVLSGFNIAIVIAFILFVFAFLPLAIRVLLAGLFVALFVTMVGGEASVIRATLMSFVGLLAVLSGREYVARQALMISFLAIILYDPSSLLESVSLHLSFLATAGIVYWSEQIKSVIAKFITSAFLVELLTTTVAAYLATLPYVMYAFGTVSAYALIANVLVVPLVPLAMLLSFATLAASYVSSAIALLFGFADSFLINIMIFVANQVSSLPGSQLVLPVSLFGMCAAYAGIVIVILYLSRNKKDETLLTTEQGFLTDIVAY